MINYRFDVIIVGAGPAGVAAAGTLAGSGISVALLETGVYAGAENWSGCVYFAENLAAPDCFGPAAVQEAPFERQVVRRGTLMHSGLDEVGAALTDPAAFTHCYTVLRPVYDPYFAALARARGAALLTGTTVTSLIRKEGRVIGVGTNRGPLYAGVVFIAEGDASHLVRSEQLERVREPHYLQGVKAVLSLPAGEIEQRFKLNRGEGAAFEILVRNASLGGRTSRLNLGGFLYTNREGISLGYVVPLDNLKKHYCGDHSLLYEWYSSLPHIREFTRDGKLSAYGAKIIRSGGWRERPVLVEDGLAVGGASAGLGIDVPFPNFTGPASATGLYFGRAIKQLLSGGKSFSSRNLDAAYLEPLRQSVYGRNARYLSRWPGYFSRTSVLFGATTDLACGSARFLSDGGLIDAGRFLRGHVLSPRGLRLLLGDSAAMLSALRLWKPLAKTLLNPKTFWSWTGNQFRRTPVPDPRLRFIMNIGESKPDISSLRKPLGKLMRRLSPAFAEALALIYANDSLPMERKFRKALIVLLRAFRLSDLVVLSCFGLLLLASAAASALLDAFRYYVLKIPADKMLAEPVMAYQAAQRKARDLDSVKPKHALEAKLATNTYHVGSASHIRTLWPLATKHHDAMAQAGIWWICPARVYSYDAPLAGRGKITVNWENCIKCESCWRAEPERVLWGRFSDHKLIYRPASPAVPLLIESLRKAKHAPLKPVATIDKQLWYTSDAILHAVHAIAAAVSAYRNACGSVPASATVSRTDWPIMLGERLCGRLAGLEKMLHADSRHDAARDIESERMTIERRLRERNIIHALYAVRRIEQRLRAWFGEAIAPQTITAHGPLRSVSYDEAAQVFPDRIVKEWEEQPLPPEWAEKIRRFASAQAHSPLPAIRVLSSVSPALGLIAAKQMAASAILSGAGAQPVPGIAACDAAALTLSRSGKETRISGSLKNIPVAATTALLLVKDSEAYQLRLDAPGVTITPSPGIGFRAAGFATISIDAAIPDSIVTLRNNKDHDSAAYLAVALGAGDYVSRRAQEHAAGRIQFGGQMLDTEGRDGIAKLGAVKALVARVEAWRLLLETLYDNHPDIAGKPASPHYGQVACAVAALAFGPERGSLAYDAGQVFGGFAYSEDDLLSRFYRDSSLFRFLRPGYGAAEQLADLVAEARLDTALQDSIRPLPASAEKPLDQLVLRWRKASDRVASIPRSADKGLTGEATAIVLAARLLLARLDAELESGKSPEALAAAALVLLELADDAAVRATISAGRGGVSPEAVFPTEPDRAPCSLDLSYEAFCGLPAAPHRSGLFLRSVFDRRPRYVPEMQLHDADLRALWGDLVSWFKTNCRDKQYDGMPFERYVEQVHDLPKEIIAEVKRRKWLATYIHREEDGLGWRKAKYYALNSAAGSYGDAALCLLIMASTSIGTTPILLGLEEELPRVREELEPLARDESQLGEIGTRLRRIVDSLANPNPGRIRKEFEELMRLVDNRIRRTRVVKYLAANFLRAFYGAGLAGRRGDFAEFSSGLRKAVELFDRLVPDVRSGLAELPRRERCHRFYLRTLGHGGVSAFALTEPTAGSDSGGVKTTAALKTAILTAMPDGRYAFSPTGEFDKCLRYLIDADRVVFTDEGMAYLAPDDTPKAIRYDRFDYAGSTGSRFYEYQGKVCEFHDIGQVRTTDAGPVYEYYSLTGAKMWITNGGIATQFSLFAQTAEGVTGFMVDRHAEGLKVGADERKMGQRGSPTNELALDGARVPREAVIGYEGHGQVNALETLNVGRCGLAAVAGALARKVLQEVRAAVPPSPTRDVLLGEAAAIMFGSESLAYYLIGLFDRPHESVRMESAIAKFICSEDIHEILSLAEQALGPESQSEGHLLEKARRDARILNIYEGTNEVQRFLILKDLIALAREWPELPEELPERPPDAGARPLARWKNLLRNHVREASALLGDVAWSDAMLQPGMFLLAEMAGEILRLECVWHRMEWLAHRRILLGADYTDPLIAAGERSAGRTLVRLAHLEESYADAWQRISANRDVAATLAGDTVLDRAAMQPHVPSKTPLRPSTRVRVLAIIRGIAHLSPAPVLDQGRLNEILWQIDPEDRSALDQAFDLQYAGGTSALDVLFIGPAEQEELLREAAAGADRCIRLDARHPDFSEIARAVTHLEENRPYDVIVSGSRTSDGSEGLAAFLAGYLGRDYTHATDMRAIIEESKPPVVAAMTTTSTAPVRDMAALISAMQSDIMVIAPHGHAGTQTPIFSRPRIAAVQSKVLTTPAEAAAYLKAFAAASRSAVITPYSGTVTKGPLPKDAVVWSIIGPEAGKAERAALNAAATAAELFGVKACCLIAAPGSMQPNLLGLAASYGFAQACCLDTGEGTLSEAGREAVLSLLRDTAHKGVAVYASIAWNDVAGKFAGSQARAGQRAKLVLNASTFRTDASGLIFFAIPAFDGKLVREEGISEGPCFVTVTDSAESADVRRERKDFSAVSIDVPLRPPWISPIVPEPAVTLSTADVIIDLGYGVRDRSGYELARTLGSKLEALGLNPMFGATRKVTQDLKLLPLDAQIGQTGVRVNPRLLISLGISGAPQHVDYLGDRADVFCFNKDPDAPLMKLNETRPSPRIHPIPGDLFVTVRELIEQLE